MLALILLGIAGALPGLMILAGIVALILGLVALLANGIKWARIPNRKIGAGVAGAALVLTLAGGALSGTEGTGSPEALIDEPAVAETLQSDLASYVGKSCEFDYQVMTQAAANNYCDADSTGALVWVDQDTHDRAETDLAAAREAETKKAAEAKKKSEEAAAAKAKAVADAKKAEAAAAAKAEAAAEAKAAQKAADAQAAKVREQEAKSALAAEEAREEQESAEAKMQTFTGSTSYENCTAVRDAGAAPIYRGDPGYSSKLDRDGDGVACEK
ncbi:excalibur calcium-binding domain-containing protein [Paeniglutamicibacter sp.]|uniref:excalibur calcium-binding domain-containing protein n=1 Tax=Paeniglutamicibacter sp. TaxID=1934391 RepID=UPI00398923A5